MYSDIWTPDTDPRNSNDCVVMTVGNNSQLIWKDIPCLSEEYESKPIQVCKTKNKTKKEIKKRTKLTNCVQLFQHICAGCVSVQRR